MTNARTLIDYVGNSYQKINIKDFDNWYNSHKELIDKVSTKTFNTRFILVDDLNNRFKLIRRKGKMILSKMNPDNMLTKHDIMNKLAEFESMIRTGAALEATSLRSLEKLDFVEPDLTKTTQRFTV